MFIEEQIEQCVLKWDSQGLERIKAGIEEAIDRVGDRIDKHIDMGRSPDEGDRLALKEAQKTLVTVESQISKVRGFASQKIVHILG